MLLDDVERTPRERTDTVVYLLSALPAATFQLTTELGAVVHPLRHRRTSHPSRLSGLTMRATGQQNVDSEMLQSDNPDGRVWSGTDIRIGPHPGSNADGREIGSEISELAHGSSAT